jgi:hypothetical protein
VTEETKKKLDILQARLTIGTGKKISLQDLLDRISDFALRYEEEIVKRLPPLSEDPAWKDAKDWGVKTDASRVDEYLYS